jgi:hypothetical protein
MFLLIYKLFNFSVKKTLKHLFFFGEERSCCQRRSMKNYRLFLSNIMYISSSKARNILSLMLRRITGIPSNQIVLSV